MAETSPPKKSMHKNQVLADDARVSQNFFESDLIFRHYLETGVSPEGLNYMKDKLTELGGTAALQMDELSMLADKNGPELVKRNAKGETIDEIRFHPAYWDLMKIAVKSEMFRVKWEPSLRKKFGKERHRLGFSSGYLYAMSEMGQYCPLCMTDGVAKLIDCFAEDDDRNRLMEHIYTNNPNELFTGAMFLTEKSGGSDVGANLVSARQFEEDFYHLNGEKWFCSNANADLIFALARTDNNISGIKGLSIFLIEKHLADGSRNPIDVIRLKEKLGVRSMASAECMLTNTVGKLVGEEFRGFAVMAEMINLSRIYTALGALTGSRRALIEAYQHLCFRYTFGKKAIGHALIRTKLTELGSMHIANFYLVWRAIRALDASENGDEKERELLRLLTPMVKKFVSERGVYIARESMELMGGIGYIEDTVMPKIMRDLMVNPIWEGSGNIMILDMLRALEKSKGFEIMCDEISTNISAAENHSDIMQSELDNLMVFPKELTKCSQDEKEHSSKVFFERLTRLYELSLLISANDPESQAWIAPAIAFLQSKSENEKLATSKPLSVEEVSHLIAWEF